MASEAGATRKRGLLSAVSRVLRTSHYSLRTEQAYLSWIRRFIAENRPYARANWAHRQ